MKLKGHWREEKRSNAPVRNQITVPQSASQKPSYAQYVYTMWYTNESCNKFDVSRSLTEVREVWKYFLYTQNYKAACEAGITLGSCVHNISTGTIS